MLVDYPYNGAGDQTTTAASTALAYNNLAQTSNVTPSGGQPDTYAYSSTGQSDLTSTTTSAVYTSLQNSSIEGVTATTVTPENASFMADPHPYVDWAGHTINTDLLLSYGSYADANGYHTIVIPCSS